MEAARSMLPGVTFCESGYEAAQDADAVALVTEWDMFRALDLRRLREVMAAPVLIDLRNVYAPHQVEAAGFRYHSIGR